MPWRSKAQPRSVSARPLAVNVPFWQPRPPVAPFSSDDAMVRSMKEMNRWGIGPKFALASVLTGVPILAAGHLWRETFAIEGVPAHLLRIMGGLLLALGIAFFVTAAAILHRGFAHGKLFTSGVYGLCRHPIYASWIVFLVPGGLLLARSWACIIVPFAMYGWLRHFVRDEEAWLETKFQDEYRQYRRRVPAVLPLPRFWLTSRRDPRER